MVREHGEGAIGLLVGAVHLLDEVAPEVPVLKPDRVAGFLQNPSNPGRPVSIGLVEADEEVTLGALVIGHRVSAPPIKHSILDSIIVCFGASQPAGARYQREPWRG